MALLSMKTLRKHPSLIPLVFFCGGGMIMSVVYLVRLAVASPEVSWRKQSNREPWQAYDKKQYKLYNAIGRDYSDTPKRPEF